MQRSCWEPAQMREDLVVNAAEPAVRHYDDLVAIRRLLRHRGGELVHAVEARDARAERTQYLGGTPGQPGLIDEHAIGVGEAAGKLGFHDAELHRVRARLEYREDALAAGQAGAQPG